MKRASLWLVLGVWFVNPKPREGVNLLYWLITYTELTPSFFGLQKPFRTRSFEFNPLPQKGSEDLFHLLNNTLRRIEKKNNIYHDIGESFASPAFPTVFSTRMDFWVWKKLRELPNTWLVKRLPYTPRKQSIGSSHSELPHRSKCCSYPVKSEAGHLLEGVKTLQHEGDRESGSSETFHDPLNKSFRKAIGFENPSDEITANPIISFHETHFQCTSGRTSIPMVISQKILHQKNIISYPSALEKGSLLGAGRTTFNRLANILAMHLETVLQQDLAYYLLLENKWIGLLLLNWMTC